MGSLSHRIDPRFLQVLATAFANGPLTEFEVRNIFMQNVPNRNLSLRALDTFLDLAMKGGLLLHEHGIWRLTDTPSSENIRKCLHNWASPHFSDDEIFRNRCSTCLDEGYLSPKGDYTRLSIMANRKTLTQVEWSRLVSGPCDIRQLTGKESKHVKADFLVIYRNEYAPPISDDPNLIPRIESRLLPDLPTSPFLFLKGIHRLRRSWQLQIRSILGGIALEDFSAFITYAKDMLDLLFWGRCVPLRSTISVEDLSRVSDRFQRYALRSKELTAVWRSLPGIYRTVSRLSWGIRYLSNNLAHPKPPKPELEAFLRICNMPKKIQSSISSERAGQRLLTIARSLRIIQRALADWRGKSTLVRNWQDCTTAVSIDRLDDKLHRRSFAERIRSLQVVPSVYILDTLTYEIHPPPNPTVEDTVLRTAGILSGYDDFIDSIPGNAYAELRLALHSALDFSNRFNIHSLTSNNRFDGVWSNSLKQLVTRLENLRDSVTSK